MRLLGSNEATMFEEESSHCPSSVVRCWDLNLGMELKGKD